MTAHTNEINIALKAGYTISKAYELLNYRLNRTVKFDKSNKRVKKGLFGSYIDSWLKVKQEASSWPPGCESEEAKLAYLRQYKDEEGIELARENML